MKKKKIILTIIFSLIIICTILSFSFAYYTLNVDSEYDISTTVVIPDCAGVELTDISSINISGDYASPIEDEKLLNSSASDLNHYKYTFKVKNKCSDSTNLKIAFAPTLNSTMPIKALKYIMVPTNQSVSGKTEYTSYMSSVTKQLSDQIIADTKINTNLDVNFGYELSLYNGSTLSDTISLSSNEEKTYDLYIWIDYYEGDKSQSGMKNNLTINKTLEGILLISNYSSMGTTFHDYTLDGSYDSPMLLASAIMDSAVDASEYDSANESWGLIKEEEGNNNVINYRYIGQNPGNFVLFNGELWRIIGVFNEDTTGKSTPLVKIIRNTALGSTSGTTMPFDYKASGVGSSDSSSGSSDWSDAQLMYMLNGDEYINTGKDSGGNVLHSHTLTNGYITAGTTKFYSLKNGTDSYLNGGGTLCKPSSVSSGGTHSCTNITISNPLSQEAQSMIEEVTWHLGGASSYTSSSTGLPSNFYNYERGTTVYSGRPVTWDGKIAIAYMSDLGYATSGGSTKNRDQCLNYQMSSWSSTGYNTDCRGNSWLYYHNSTASSAGTTGSKRFLEPNTGNGYQLISFGTYATTYSSSGSYFVMPTLYLKNDVKVVGGKGTIENPIIIISSMNGVTLNPNGGSVSPTSITVFYGQTYGTIPTPTRPGYHFDGWYTSSSGGTQVNSNTIVNNSGSHTLYAHWTQETYTVTLDQQSGSGGTSSVTATYGNAMPSITVPTRSGYTFGGYYTATNGGGTQYYTSSGASAGSYTLTSNTTLYAKWTQATYTVTLDQQSGSGGTSSVTATYGNAMPSITVPTRSGYTFGGYYTETSGGGTQYYTSTGASAGSYTLTSNTTLYAKWTAKTYTAAAGTLNLGYIYAYQSGNTSYGYYQVQFLYDGITRTGTSVTITNARVKYKAASSGATSNTIYFTGSKVNGTTTGISTGSFVGNDANWNPVSWTSSSKTKTYTIPITTKNVTVSVTSEVSTISGQLTPTSSASLTIPGP